MEKNTKIVMISMFKNESKGIRRMLESCYKYIDYYILQNNGSTDGTEKIVEEFFKDKNIPGFVYEVEEGWISFGWNRNHLLQTCQQTNHGCDWIMKMDCDEYLEVDDDFDWSFFDNHSHLDALSVAALSLGSVSYIRTWIWNADREWIITNDTSHETIYMVTPEGKVDSDNVNRLTIPKEFRLVGTSDGESYISPTKYVSDALLLEEQMLRENTIFSDLYHFWYIGKSYYDAIFCQMFPFDDHYLEYTRRSAYYFTKYLDHCINFSNVETPEFGDEMSYYAGYLLADCYIKLGDIQKAIDVSKKIYYVRPTRNDCLLQQVEIYLEIQDLISAEEILNILLDPERKNPFPDKDVWFINPDHYIDTGNYINDLKQKLEKMKIEIPNVRIINRDTPDVERISTPIETTSNNSYEPYSGVTYLDNFNINSDDKLRSRIYAIDNFYEDPYAIREFALNSIDYTGDSDWYKGSRSNSQYFVPGTKEKIEQIMGIKITNFESHNMCGKFQYCTSEDPVVYHYDLQKWAGMVYLTPDAPYSTGTSLYSHKTTQARDTSHPLIEEAFPNGFFDSTQYELVDTVGNVFNRLVLFDAQCIHAASGYFGNTRENSRLFHLFFFD